MANLSTAELVDAIAGLTLLEVSDLVKAIEDKFGVKAAAPVAAFGMAPAAAAPTVVRKRSSRPSSPPVSRLSVRTRST